MKGFEIKKCHVKSKNFVEILRILLNNMNSADLTID